MNFDRLAPHYDWLEALTAGSRLQRARAHWLPALRGRRHLLSVGEGHGRLADACIRQLPEIKLTCVEASAGMRRLANRRLGEAGQRINWHQCDVLDWQSESRYDAIATCFFLDCFEPEALSRVITRLAGVAAPDALWLLVDFSLPPTGLRRWRAWAVHCLMYAFFRVFTRLPARRLTPPDRLLEAQGFRCRGRQEFEWGLIRAEIWQRVPTAA